MSGTKGEIFQCLVQQGVHPLLKPTSLLLMKAFAYSHPSLCIISCIIFPESTESYGDEIIARSKTFVTHTQLAYSWGGVLAEQAFPKVVEGKGKQ